MGGHGGASSEPVDPVAARLAMIEDHVSKIMALLDELNANVVGLVRRVDAARACGQGRGERGSL